MQADDIAQIQYTSGTTGFPKGAELHHRGLTNNARFYAQRIGLQPGEVYVNPMPMFHTAGCAMGVLGTCQSLAVHIPVLAFDPALMLELLETERSDMFAGVPTMMIALLEHPDLDKRDLSSLRVAVSGGSPVPAGLVRRVEERLGVRFSIVFGTTECSPLVTQVRPDAPADRRAETLGTPLPQTEVKVADLVTGNPVPPGGVGELCARGYLVMRGYHDAPEATAEAIDTDGWYHTGDLGFMDADGYLRIEGRVKDMIIRGGENIYPREIEDALFAHPAIAEVAVVGVPDEKWGEVVAAYVRLGPGQAEPSDRRPARLLPRTARAVQDPAALGVRRGVPADAVRQDTEVQAAGGLHRPWSVGDGNGCLAPRLTGRRRSTRANALASGRSPRLRSSLPFSRGRRRAQWCRDRWTAVSRTVPAVRQFRSGALDRRACRASTGSAEPGGPELPLREPAAGLGGRAASWTTAGLGETATGGPAAR